MKHIKKLSVTALLVITLGAARADNLPSAGAEWEGYNKTLNGQRFSPLDQINTANAADLTEVCRAPLAERGSLQAGLVMVRDTIFVTVGNETFALDAATCQLRWKHIYERVEPPVMPVNRGVAYLNGRIFRGTDDGRLIALEAQTGQEVWRDVLGDARSGESITSAPLAWNGLVFIGLAVGESGIRGRILAFEALTGRQVWQFNTIPLGNERGADTWVHTDWAAHGGGGTWSTFSLDPTSGELFVPVGNPVPDLNVDARPGTNLFTNSALVLDALTGKLRWWYQLAPHDAYDHDLGAAPMLFRNGRNQLMLAAGGKDGYLHVVDRISHRLVYKVPVTTVDPVPKKLTPSGVKVCPGIVGGVEWNGPAFDPQLNTIFVGAVDYCSVLRSGTRDALWAPVLMAKANFGGTWAPSTDSQSGWINAVDADTGALRWKYHAEGPAIAGVTPTAGGVLLSGDAKGDFFIFESSTGKLLKEFDTGGSIAGGVITYDVKGKQYVALTSGSVSRATWGALGRPSVIILSLPVQVQATAHAGGPDLARGKQLYSSTCALCHGADGKNISGFDLSSIAPTMSEDQLVAWIKNPAPPMPKMFAEPLNADDETEIRDIAAFLSRRGLGAR